VVAWEDDGEGSREIYLRRWTGQSWEELGRSATGGGISGTPGASVRPSLALDSEGRPAVAWQEETAPGNTEVYFRRWDGKSWVAAAESASRGGISGTPGLSVDPMMALDREGRIVVAWNEWSMGTPEIYLRRWVPPVR
jgi:type IV secretory pathway protease TraF